MGGLEEGIDSSDFKEDRISRLLSLHVEDEGKIWKEAHFQGFHVIYPERVVLG